MKSINYNYKRIAQGYKNRPFLHREVINKFIKDIGKEQFQFGMDVGCGAGLSTRALSNVCTKVIGTDISSQMIGNSEYSAWWRNEYLQEYPKPYRNEYVWKQNDVKNYGFEILNQEELKLKHTFDLNSFIEFMMIQSNVNVKIERGENEEAVRNWFKRTLSPIFDNNQTVIFKGYCWYIKKSKK